MKRLLTIGGVGLAYAAAAKLGLSMAFPAEQVTAIWPPTGIAVAALLLLGVRVWPGIFAAAFAVNLTLGEPWMCALAIGAGNTAAGIAAALVLRELVELRHGLERKRDVLALTAVAGGTSLISATWGTLVLVLAGVLPASEMARAWLIWWVGDTLGVLIVAPVILTWARAPALGWKGWRAAELLALALAVALVSALAFGVSPVHHHLNRAYWVFPLLMWAGLRFGPREVVTSTLLITGVAVYGTSHGLGPFAGGSLAEDLLLVDAFAASYGISGLLIGAVTAERRDSERRIRQARDELEQRVRERTTELQASNEALSRKNEEIESFVYLVTHDLRAPLINVQGFSAELDRSYHELDERLRAAPLPRDVRVSVGEILGSSVPTALRYIGTSVAKFQRLIDSLLAVSRTGRRELAKETIDVQALVAGVIATHEPQIANGHVQFRVGLLPPATGDPTALAQVFDNLIRNAIQYLSPSRPGVIEVGGERGGGRSHYWVRDNGLGIPAAARSRVFMVFQRFHPKHADGDGVGLAIVKRIVEGHGGRIWFESEEGVGTTFHLDLPTASVAEEAPT